MPDKYAAKLGPYLLDIQDISDTIEKSLAKHEFPYCDGALLEDMGQRARSITFRCYFYNETYADHKSLLIHLKLNKKPIEFTHPKYGLIKGSVQTIAVRHDDKQATAEMDITFIESITEGDTARQPDVDVECEDLFEKSIEEQKTEFANDVRAELGAEAEGILSKELDPSKGILEQFAGLTRQAREYVKTVDTYVNKLESAQNTISNPANSLIATIDFGTFLPGRVIGTAAKTMERYSILYEKIKNSPVRFVQGFLDGATALEDSLGFPKHTGIAATQRVALDLGYIYSTDEGNRQAARRLENVKSFNASGQRVKTDSVPALLTINEIERSLSDVRAKIQASIDESREMQTLKDMALVLQEHAYTVKIESEKLVPVTIDNTLPLHLVCLMHDLPYQYAERIHSVNNIKHPNFTKGDIKVYVRQSAA